MRSKSSFVCIALLLSGCASSNAPREWLSSSDQMQTQAFGGWVEVSFVIPDTAAGKPAEGELIAVEQESLIVMIGTKLSVLPKKRISKVKLTAYYAESGAVRTWGGFGMLSTLSHGFALIFSLPVWGIATIVTNNSAVHLPEVLYPESAWDELRKFARFPQGVPPNLDRGMLRPKPAIMLK